MTTSAGRSYDNGMKKIILITCVLFSLSSFANDKAIGVSIGNPIGLNGKYWLDDKAAVDGGVGFSIGSNRYVSLHSDYLLHSLTAFYLNDTIPLDLYYGLGGRMKFGDEIEIGARVPVGLVHKLPDNTADMFGEVAPIFDFISHTGVSLHLLVGARYYF